MLPEVYQWDGVTWNRMGGNDINQVEGIMGLDTDHRIGGSIELNSVGNRFISASVTRGK